MPWLLQIGLNGLEVTCSPLGTRIADLILAETLCKDPKSSGGRGIQLWVLCHRFVTLKNFIPGQNIPVFPLLISY